MKGIKGKTTLTIGAGLLLAIAVLGWVDQAGNRYAEQGFKRALVAYAIARTLNGVISVAQGTEVAVEPAGVGMIFTPGQILDPVNDLIERFAWVVLASGTALGAQRLMIEMTAWIWFSIVVSIVVIAALAFMWREPSGQPRGWRRSIYRLALVLLIVRFSLPLFAMFNEALFVQFMEPQYNESSDNLSNAARQINRVNEQTGIQSSENPSVTERLGQLVRSAGQAIDVEARYEALMEDVEDASEDALNLMVIFILQTLVFPLLFLWLVLKLLQFIMFRAFADDN